MNLGVPHDIARGDTCLGRNWWKRNKQAWSPAGEGRVDPRGRKLGRGKTEIRDASMTPTARPMKPRQLAAVSDRS